MKSLFNQDWSFSLFAIPDDLMYIDDSPNFLEPESFYEQSKKLSYNPIELPHDWLIKNTKELYKNSVGFYKKTINLTEEQIKDKYCALYFEGVYMNSAVYVNGNLAGKCKYGYSSFEHDISLFLHEGENQILVIAVYQNCNTRWYSGAGIFRNVYFINTSKTHLSTDGIYIVTKPNSKEVQKLDEHIVSKDEPESLWTIKISSEVIGNVNGHKVLTVIQDLHGTDIVSSVMPVSPLPVTEEESEYLRKVVPSMGTSPISKTYEEFTVSNPNLWEPQKPYYYIAFIALLDKNGNQLEYIQKNFGFKLTFFDQDKGFFLNGNHLKLNGVCQHHDLGALGSAFNINALKRQFLKLKEMGVNAIRCSHNPPSIDFMNLADQMGFMIVDEAFDMWESPKTPFDYANYFNQNWEKDCASWVRRDRNHPSLIMWSIGNEIYDTHIGNGVQITKNLYNCVIQNDPQKVAPITIASNYMWSEGAQECAKNIDLVGYNYLDRLYTEHHKKYPNWKIFGSETGSTVQSRGIYHFPDDLKLVTFSDGQCSCLGNCTVPWGALNTQTVINTERDCNFSLGQFIWTGWDYIGEPTPYHTKNSYFGQIDTAGFEKDTFYLYKAEWNKNAKPFVHLLPYWDFNEGQLIDVKAYTNADFVELFFNNKSLGKHQINHKTAKNPFGQWQVEYHKGIIKAVAYDNDGNIVAEDTKSSFEDPTKIILQNEQYPTENLFFIDIMTADQNEILVENARNYITINVEGNAKLIGLDNGDSTDYEEYQSNDYKTHTRRLFSNRLVAIIECLKERQKSNFTVTASSKGLPNTTILIEHGIAKEIAAHQKFSYKKDFIPTRKIELSTTQSTVLNKENSEIYVTAKVLPNNATNKKIDWNIVLKECVPAENIKIINVSENKDGNQTAKLKAISDGECILRCTSHNNTNLTEVYSDINLTVLDLGNACLNPYKLIEACRFTSWDKSKLKPKITYESGVTTRDQGENYITFEKVDFGPEGADTIHIPIFTFATSLPLEVWDGEPNVNHGDSSLGTQQGKTYHGDSSPGTLLGKFTYQHESIYNTYSENVFVLNKRLFGIHTISLKFFTDTSVHGFYFEQTPKAFSKLRALDATIISGDEFTRTCECVEKIGNNVSLDFSNMNFGTNIATKITICGKSNIQNNTINIKIFLEDGTSTVQVVEFPFTNNFTEQTFELSKISGNTKISFVFLPGSNFDFKWFKFD